MSETRGAPEVSMKRDKTGAHVEIGSPRDCDTCGREITRGEEALVLSAIPRRYQCERCEKARDADRSAAMREDRDDAEREDRRMGW